MRYTNVDGKVYKIRYCEECPFSIWGGDTFNPVCSHPNKLDGPYITEGSFEKECPLREVCFDLDFKQALDAMLDGKIVYNENLGLARFVFSRGYFCRQDYDDEVPYPTSFTTYLILSKWMIE